MAPTSEFVIRGIGESRGFEQVAQGINKIRQASSKALEGQRKQLMELYRKRRPQVFKGTPAEVATKDLIKRLQSYGSQARVTAREVSEANRMIGQSILNVLDLAERRTGLREDPDAPSGWRDPKGRFAAPPEPGELSFYEELLEKLRILRKEHGKFAHHIESSRSIISQVYQDIGKYLDIAHTKQGRVMESAQQLANKFELVKASGAELSGRLLKLIDASQGVQSKFNLLASTNVILAPLFNLVSRASSGFANQLATLQKLSASTSMTAAMLQKNILGVAQAGGVAAVAKQKLASAVATAKGVISGINPVVLAVVGGLYALQLAAKATVKAFQLTMRATRALISILRRLINILIDVVKFLYRATSAMLDFAKTIITRAVNGVRTFFGALKKLIGGLSDTSEQADRANRKFYITTRRSWEAARAVDMVSSAAMGLTLGLSLANGNLVALALSMNWLRRSIIPILAASTALTTVVVGLGKAFTGVTNQTLEAGKTAQDVIRHFESLTRSAYKGVQAWTASAHWAIKYGRTLEEVREALVGFWQVGLDTNEMLDASHALAAAWNMELSEAADVIKTAIGEEEGQIETLREYGIVIDDVTNATERNARATAVATAVTEKYSDAAERYVQDLSGALQRAKSAIEFFWEAFTEPLATKVLGPIINMFANFAASLSTLVMALWKSEKAQSYFNATLSKARQLVERFRPEITILGNIVRTIVAAAFWALQKAMRAVVNVAERLLGWIRQVFAALRQLAQPIKPLVDMFGMLARAWKEISFTELLQKAKEFVFDFPITLGGITFTLQDVLDNMKIVIGENIWDWAKWVIATIGLKLLDAITPGRLGIGSLSGTLTTVLLDFIGRTIQKFLDDSYPELEGMWEKMFDLARWSSMIGGAFFGVKGALIGYLAGLLVGFLDESFDLGIHDWISTGLEKIGDYFLEKWNLFWENFFVTKTVLSPIDKVPEQTVIGVDFDAAFNALAESFKEDWENIFRPAIRDFLDMPEGATMVSDYIGYAMKEAIERAGWIAENMVLLYNAIKDAWKEHVVPAWEEYIAPELDNLWTNYLQPPLQRLAQKWSDFWTVMFGGEAEFDVEWDPRWWGEDWDPEVFKMEDVFEESNILQSLQTFAEELDKVLDFFRDAAEPTSNFAKAMWNLGEAGFHAGRAAYYLAGGIIKLALAVQQIWQTFLLFVDKSDDSVGIFKILARRTEVLKNKFKNWADKLEIAYSFASDVYNIASSLGNLIRNVLSGDLSNIVQDTDDVNDAFGGLWDTWEKFVNRWLEEQIQPWLGYFQYAYDWLFGDTWSEDMEKGWEDMWSEFQRISNSVDSNILQPVRTIFDRFKTNYYTPWKEKIDEMWDDLFGQTGTINSTSQQTDTNALSPIRGFFDTFRDTYMPTWTDDLEGSWLHIFGANGVFASEAGEVEVRAITPIVSAFTNFRDNTWPSLLDPIKKLWTDIWGNEEEGKKGLFSKSLWDWLDDFVKWIHELNRTHGPLYNLRVAFQEFEGVLRNIIKAYNEIVETDWEVPDLGGGGGTGGFGNDTSDETSSTTETEEEEDPDPTCFAHDTPIIMVDGNRRYIQDINPDDVVLAFDPETEDFVSGFVTSTISRVVDSYYEITLEDRTVKVTGEHPFYMPDATRPKVHGKFVRAKSIKVGDKLFTDNGKSLNEVEVKDVKEVYKEETVYNFNVETHHTYFANGIAVHNIKALQHGGIITKPTRAILGEKYRHEAVIPLRDGYVPVQMLGGGNVNVTVQISNNSFGSPQDAKEVAEIASKEILRKLRSRNVSLTGRFG